MSKEPFPVVVAWDPAIDHDHSDTAEYHTTRAIDLLTFRPGVRPVTFYLRDLDTRAVNRFVLSGIGDAEQCERAFRAGVVRVDNIELPDGRIIEMWEPKRASKVASEAGITSAFDLFTDEEMSLFDVPTVQEIGAVARTRFFSARKIEPIYQLPPTSLQILGMRLYRLAVPAKSSAADGEPASTPPATASPTTT